MQHVGQSRGWSPRSFGYRGVMSRTLVIKLTAGAEEPERANQAFTVAATAVAAGATVSLWLTGEAVWFAVPGRAEAFDLPHAAPLAELVGGGAGRWSADRLHPMRQAPRPDRRPTSCPAPASPAPPRSPKRSSPTTPRPSSTSGPHRLAPGLGPTGRGQVGACCWPGSPPRAPPASVFAVGVWQSHRRVEPVGSLGAARTPPVEDLSLGSCNVDVRPAKVRPPRPRRHGLLRRWWLAPVSTRRFCCVPVYTPSGCCRPLVSTP